MAGSEKAPTREELAQSGYRLPESFFQEKAAGGAPTNKSIAPGDNKSSDLDEVDFASSAAKEAARELGLTAENFKRRRKTSDHGFNKADVERIAETVGATDDDDDDASITGDDVDTTDTQE